MSRLPILLSFLTLGLVVTPVHAQKEGEQKQSANTVVVTRDYEFIWMPPGVVPSGGHSNHLNATGQVAVNRVDGGTNPQAGRWSSVKNEFVVLDTSALGNPRSRTSVINDRGGVVGTVYGGGNHLALPFLWTVTGGMKELPTLGGSQTAPSDINNQNHVVGWSATGNGTWRAFLWTPKGGIVDLGSLAEGTESQALAINERGWVVGGAVAEDDHFHPFFMTPMIEMTDIGLPDGNDRGGFAVDVNDKGTVLVQVRTGTIKVGESGHVLCRPYVWTKKHGLVQLPCPPGYDDVRASAINNEGDVLLNARKIPRGDLRREARRRAQARHGFLVSSGKLIELPNAEGMDHTYYEEMNEDGWMVGRAVKYEQDDNGKVGKSTTRGFVAKPIR